MSIDAGDVTPVKRRFPRREFATGFDRDEHLRQLYLGHAGSLRRYAYRCGVPGHDIDDVVADAFLVAWRKLESIPSPPAERLWLLGVARNLISKQQGTSWRRDRLVERLRSNVQTPDPEAPSEHVVLREAIRHLPPNERDAVRLVEWEGLSHEDAAVVMECSSNASRLRLHSAKARLRSMLGSDGGASSEIEVKEGADG
ncbi:MAG: RNA polymerase sigma factor [Acidimicrobiales bacterium]